MKRLCIVIVNYKTPQLTLDCIDSLHNQIDPNQDHIVVVDNGSGGNDYSFITSKIKDRGLSHLTTIIFSKENGGFSAGNNIGIKAVEAEFYILANADTLFRKDAVQGLINLTQEYPEMGLYSPRLEWLDGEPQPSCFHFRSPLSELISAAGTGVITTLFKKFIVYLPLENKDTFPEWTSFACVLIKQEVFKKIGFLDEGYFLYYEDEDFCRRANDAGFNIVNSPDIHVVHLRGQSTGMKKLQKEKKRLPQYHYSSRSRYFTKFYGKTGYLISNLCWIVGRSVSLAREILLGKKRTVPEYQHIDIWKK